MRETSHVEMLLASDRNMVAPLQAEKGELGEVTKSASLQPASEMQLGLGESRVCPKCRVGGVEGEGL